MKTEPITFDEILAELNVGKKDDGEFRTQKEWAEHWGISDRRATVVLQGAKRVGRLDIRSVVREALSGKMVPVPGYRIVAAKRKK